MGEETDDQNRIVIGSRASLIPSLEGVLKFAALWSVVTVASGYVRANIIAAYCGIPASRYFVLSDYIALGSDVSTFFLGSALFLIFFLGLLTEDDAGAAVSGNSAWRKFGFKTMLIYASGALIISCFAGGYYWIRTRYGGPGRFGFDPKQSASDMLSVLRFVGFLWLIILTQLLISFASRVMNSRFTLAASICIVMSISAIVGSASKSIDEMRDGQNSFSRRESFYFEDGYIYAPDLWRVVIMTERFIIFRRTVGDEIEIRPTPTVKKISV